MNEPQMELYDVTEPRQVPNRMKWKVYRTSRLSFKNGTYQNWKILDQKFHLSARLPRKILKIVWQIEQVQHEGSTGELVADEMTIAPEIDFRIQGIPHEEVEQDAEKRRKRCCRRLVSAIINHENEDALVSQVHSKHPYPLFSEESNRFLHDQGSVEGFELCEISPSRQCLECAKD